MADHDIAKMKVADLKKELKLRNLPTAGNKNELVERLQVALLDGDTILDDAPLNADDILDDDVLNDDELDDDVDDEKSLLDPSLEDAVLKTPPEAKAPVSALDAIPAQKKVVLKRKFIEPVSDAPAVIASPTSQPSDAPIAAAAAALNISTGSLKSDDDDDGSAVTGATPTKVPKIPITAPSADEGVAINVKAKVADGGQLTHQERLELRAKRFGAPAVTAATPAAAKKPATTPVKAAADESAANKVPKIPITAPLADDGIVINVKTKSTVAEPATDNASGDHKNLVKLSEVAQLTYQERMELRAKRFGMPTVPAATTTPVKVAAAKSALADAEQLKKRAERFGLTVADESAKFAARAERFGTAAAATATAAKNSNGAVAANPELVEQMRRRAERFGGSVSTVMLKIEHEEKLRLREKRFVPSAADAASSAAAETTAEVATVTATPAVAVASAPTALAAEAE